MRRGVVSIRSTWFGPNSASLRFASASPMPSGPLCRLAEGVFDAQLVNAHLEVLRNAAARLLARSPAQQGRMAARRLRSRPGRGSPEQRTSWLGLCGNPASDEDVSADTWTATSLSRFSVAVAVVRPSPAGPPALPDVLLRPVVCSFVVVVVLVRDLDPVVDSGDARCRPGGRLSFLPLPIGAYATFERHCAVRHRDGDLASVDLRRPL